MSNFIPSLHFKPAESKLSDEWCNDVVDYYVFNKNLINLLHGKNIAQIDGFASGVYDLRPFKRMFRSLRKQQKLTGNVNIPQATLDSLDTTGLQWECVPIIPPKLNSAIATTQKIPIEITCTCIDPLAQKKKDEDLEFLRAKPMMEETLQPLYDSMNLGKVDLGATKHSSVPYTSLPMDLDIKDDDEFRIFASLIYNLAPETAFENVLQQYYLVKKLVQLRLLETRDQYKYAVSVNRAMPDKITGLPDAEYIFPEIVQTDGSKLPDYSDNMVRTITYSVTPMELFKYFPDEICDEDALDKIVNGPGEKGDWSRGYCHCNSDSIQVKNNWGTYKMSLRHVEIKSVDSIMIAQKKNSKFKYFTNDENKCTGKIWAQNTYVFYWLSNTKWFFGKDRLGFAHRSPGNETYTNFSTNIYKSQEKSAVELCIGENIKAQMADIKLQHAIIMSKPAGQVIDMRYIRSVIDGLTDDLDKYTEKDLLDKGEETNTWLMDSEGFEGRQQGQFTPVRDLPGGLKDEVVGYYRVIAEAKQNISIYTGINDQLTAQSANPEGLVGLQKLLVNGSINNLYYVHEALISQYQSLFNNWAWCIQQAIKKGGKTKQAIINIIGKHKVQGIVGLDDVALHEIGVTIKLGLREEERAQFKMDIAQLKQKGVISAVEEYYIINTPNPKDALWLIAMAEKKFIKRQDKIRQEQNASNQKIIEQQGQNMLQNTQAQTEGKIQQIQSGGEVKAKLLQLGSELGMSEKQLEGLIKRTLQKDRTDGQKENKLSTIYANKQLEQQEALT